MGRRAGDGFPPPAFAGAGSRRGNNGGGRAAHEGRPYGGRDGSPHPRGQRRWAGRPRGTALRGEGWVPAPARTTEVGGRPRGTALRGEGWVPASARTREGRAVREPPARIDSEWGLGSLLGGLFVYLDAVPAPVQDQNPILRVDLYRHWLPEFFLFFRHVRYAGSLIPEGGVAA